MGRSVPDLWVTRWLWLGWVRRGLAGCGFGGEAGRVCVGRVVRGCCCDFQLGLPAPPRVRGTSRVPIQAIVNSGMAEH